MNIKTTRSGNNHCFYFGPEVGPALEQLRLEIATKQGQVLSKSQIIAHLIIEKLEEMKKPKAA